MREEAALKLKEYLYDAYHIELGEIASKQVIDYMYPIIEQTIYEETKAKIKNETVNEMIDALHNELELV